MKKILLLIITITALCGCNVLLYSDGERFNQKYYTNKDDSPIFKLVGTYKGNQFYELDEKYRNENEYGLLVNNQKVIKVVDEKSYPEIRSKLEFAPPETTIARPINSNNNQDLANQNNLQKPPDKPLTEKQKKEVEKLDREIANAFVKLLGNAFEQDRKNEVRTNAGWCVNAQGIGGTGINATRVTSITTNSTGFQINFKGTGFSGSGTINCNHSQNHRTTSFTAQCFKC
jgi:hypothetical protein